MSCGSTEASPPLLNSNMGHMQTPTSRRHPNLKYPFLKPFSTQIHICLSINDVTQTCHWTVPASGWRLVHDIESRHNRIEDLDLSIYTAPCHSQSQVVGQIHQATKMIQERAICRCPPYEDVLQEIRPSLCLGPTLGGGIQTSSSDPTI